MPCATAQIPGLRHCCHTALSLGNCLKLRGTDARIHQFIKDCCILLVRRSINLFQFRARWKQEISVPKVSLWEGTMNTLSKYKFWIGGAFCLIVIGLIIGALRPKHISGAQSGASPDVEVVQVEQKDVPIFGEWIGTLDGFTNADVRAQVSGYLQKQGYQEGAFVRKGQLLFEIDPRPFQAVLAQAEGQLAQAKATLANAHAVQGRTELDVNRYAPLAREQAASQQDLDNAVQNNMAAKATVATALAQIKSAEAAVETAKINVDLILARAVATAIGRAHV